MGLDYSDQKNFDAVNGQSAFAKRLGQKFGTLRCMWSFASLGGAIATAGMQMVDCVDGVTAVKIPKGAHVTAAYYRVLTSCASATSAGTLALSLVAANDLTTATAINNGTTWIAESAPVLCTPVKQTASTWLLTTADSYPTATIAVEAFTAGKVILWLEYALVGDLPLT